MSVSRFTLYLLGFLWCFVVTLLSWIFFCIPHWIKGTFESVKWQKNLSIVWDVANDSKFFKKSMDGWYGFVVGANIIVIDVPSKADDWWEKHFKHETTHVIQNYILGIFFYPIYILYTLGLWLFRRDRHAYHDNFLERWARRKAHQTVDVPKDAWLDGPNDRWPWW